LYVFLYST